jgi:phosphoribosylformylglycinamidine synthase
VEHRRKIAFRREDRTIIVLGGVLTGHEAPLPAFGSSQYAQTILGSLWGIPPWVDLPLELRVQGCCRQLIEEDLIDSAHDLSDGGLAVALAEASFRRGIGAMIQLNFEDDPRFLLFAEDPSRILVSAQDKDHDRIDEIVSEYNIRAAIIGRTGGSSLDISWRGQKLFQVPVEALRLAYDSALPQAVEAMNGREVR